MDHTRAGKLLLVEDEHVLRRLVAQFLRADGFEVVEAADGQEAVHTFSACGPFDAVLLDLNLPVMCGIEVCRAIKAANPQQPVLICSAAILDADVEVLQSFQVEHFLTKPYHPLDLVSAIEDATRKAASVGSGRAHAAHARAAGTHRLPAGAGGRLDSRVPLPQTLVK